ncbi:MAG TPA: nucleotidyltransferase domain-containing protein [Methylothermaceae bacterium]|nr:nucleotidyltransferase domain-containing protein [Methylothermaceae bacterium]
MKMGELDLTPDQKRRLIALLQRYLPDTEVWAYGSRVKGSARPWSDLDLVVFATPRQHAAVSALREALEESDLPFRVDLFLWDEIPEAFREEIRRRHIVLQQKRTIQDDSDKMTGS